MSGFKKYIALALLIIISLFSVFPSVIHFTDGVVEEYDALIMVWEMNQTIGKIPHNLADIFQSNIFYPFKNTLAFTHLLVPSAILSLIPVKLTGSFVSASNFTLIIGQVITALIAYFWMKDISGNKLSSFIGTVALILSRIRLNYYVHLQMWTMHWWLIPSWLFWRYFKYKELKYLYVGFIFMGITIWENVLPFYFVAAILGCLTITNVSVFRKNIKHFILGGVIAFLISLPAISVYREVSTTHGFERTIRDAAHFSAGIDELSNKYFAPSIFLLFGLSLFKLGKDKGVINKHTKWLFLVFVVSFFFTLGPVVKWGGETVKLFGKIPIPLPYSVFFYIIPGLNALRTTSRWVLLTCVSVVFLFSYAFRDLGTKKNLLPVFIFLGVSLVGASRIERIYPVPSFDNIPKVYQWLRGTDYGSILEIPMYTWTDKKLKRNEYYRLYYSLYHGRNTVGGVSGFMPRETEILLAESRKASSIDQIINASKYFDPDILIVHRDQQFQLLGRDISLNGFIKDIVWEDSDVVVIKLK